jgi:membrane protein YdbS with pleckstrin-like domain
MGRSRRQYNSRRYQRGQDVRLLVGFVVLLYVVGGALVWYFYGLPGTILGFSCVTVFIVVMVLLYLLITAVGKWAGE